MGRDGVPPAFRSQFVHQVVASPGGDGKRFGSIFVADSPTALPGHAFSREQREESCVIMHEQGQEILTPSLLLVLLSLKRIVQNKIRNQQQRMCAGGHGLRAKHPVGLCIVKQQGQTQLIRADAGQTVPSLHPPHQGPLLGCQNSLSCNLIWVALIAGWAELGTKGPLEKLTLQ